LKLGDGKRERRLDIILLFATLALVGIGIVMVYSTSAIIAGIVSEILTTF